jgi:ribonuclease D
MIETTESLILHLEKHRPKGGVPLCAVDTEANSLHRYREALCLVQFAAGGESVLIDPLAIKDLSPLGEYLSEATVWMHGADYDMTMFKREFGRLPATVYDTQIGARLLGVRRFGLGDLVNVYFGIELSKTSQKADWGKRPLSPKMIEYALNDVNYLLEMGGIISGKLREQGRWDWFVESCETARQKVLERDEAKEEMWRVRGSGKLDRRGLACLRALWEWRDAEAKAWDRPSFMVLSNNQLLEWCNDLVSGKSISLPRHFRQDRVKRFRATVAALEAMSPDQWPEKNIVKRRKRDRNFERRVEDLLKRRDEAARKLDIEGSLIAPRAALEELAAGESAAEELLMRWQRESLGLAE